jgi:DNA-binding NtrC family response regulator
VVYERGLHHDPSSSAREALEIVQNKEFDITLLDIKMPGMDGMELQARLKQADPDLTVIMMTGYASVETAVQALKRGAYDYITKPVDPDELSHLVANAMEHKRASREVARLRKDFEEISPGTELIGGSPVMKTVTELIEMGGTDRGHRPHHRRKRHGKRSRGPCHSRGRPATVHAHGDHPLRRAD